MGLNSFSFVLKMGEMSPIVLKVFHYLTKHTDLDNFLFLTIHFSAESFIHIEMIDLAFLLDSIFNITLFDIKEELHMVDTEY